MINIIGAGFHFIQFVHVGRWNSFDRPASRQSIWVVVSIPAWLTLCFSLQRSFTLILQAVDHDNYSVPGKLISPHAFTSTRRRAIHLFKPSLARTIRPCLFVLHGVTGIVHNSYEISIGNFRCFFCKIIVTGDLLFWTVILLVTRISFVKIFTLFSIWFIWA